MHVAIDARTARDHFPGIGRYVFNLVRAMAARPDAPAISLLVDPRHPSERFDLEALLRDAPNIRTVPAPWSPFSLGGQIEMPRELRALQPDVYHATYYLMPYRPGVPTVLTFYDTIPLIFPEYLPSGWNRIVYRTTARMAVQRAGLILTMSQSAAHDVQHFFGVPAERIAVTPGAADPRFRPIADRTAVEAWRKTAGLPARFGLYVGINKPHKNLARLVQAWKIVLGRWEPAWGEAPTLVLAGREDRRYKDAREAAEAAGIEESVVFFGDVSEADLPYLYNAADVFVFPSLYEGFGLPVLEAMACGVPVASSHRASLREVAGDAARVFDPLDPGQMATEVLVLLRDPAEAERRRQRSLAQAARFSWDETARLTLGAYRRLAVGQGRD